MGLKLKDFSEILDPIYKDREHSKACLARTKWVLKHRRHLDFNTVSQKRYDKNDFPSYSEEIASIMAGESERSALPSNLKLVAGV